MTLPADAQCGGKEASRFWRRTIPHRTLYPVFPTDDVWAALAHSRRRDCNTQYAARCASQLNTPAHSRTRHGFRIMKIVSQLLKNHDGALWSVTPDMTVYAALERLAEHSVGALLVMEGPRLVGVFSERDYTRKITLEGRNSKETSVREIMTSNVFTVDANTRTVDCMRLMSNKKIRHLPVMEGDTVLGMISIRDILDDIIEDHEGTIAELQRYISS